MMRIRGYPRRADGRPHGPFARPGRGRGRRDEGHSGHRRRTDEFKTLVVAAERVETLAVEGPSTAFAPTDGAVAKPPTDMGDPLLTDKRALTAALTYPVVPGKVKPADLVKLTAAKAVPGRGVKNAFRAGKVSTFRVIDAVPLPNEKLSR